MTTLSVTIDGRSREVPIEVGIAVTLALMGSGVTRRSVNGQLRTPFREMGVYQECHVMVNGHRILACQTGCQPEMVIKRSHHAKRWL